MKKRKQLKVQWRPGVDMDYSTASYNVNDIREIEDGIVVETLDSIIKFKGVPYMFERGKS